MTEPWCDETFAPIHSLLGKFIDIVVSLTACDFLFFVVVVVVKGFKCVQTFGT